MYAVVQPKEHIVLFCVEAWGHTRPLCNLAVKLVQMRPVIVTLLTTPSFVERVHKEIARGFSDPECVKRSWIRVASLPSKIIPGQMIGAEADFDLAFAQLMAEAPLKCSVTGAYLPAVPAPKAAILDFLAIDALHSVRRVDESVKILAWQHGGSAANFGTFGPKEMGGQGDMALMLDQAAERMNRTPGEIMLYTVANLKGDTYQVPGMPKMHDYEFWAQPPPVKMLEEMAAVLSRGYRFLCECDGAVQTSDAAVEPEALKAWDEWFVKSDRSIYNVGPMLQHGAAANAGEVKQSTQGQAVEEYLDQSLERCGEHSLIYISFGSLWGPWDEPEKLWILLDVLIKTGTPFILAHGSPLASIPDEVAKKVAGHGLLTLWAPQQTIFAHKATGWFLTHGGQNGVMESLSAGLPMVFWDFYGDQCVNAAHVTDDLGAACQLLEVRRGPHGLKPILRYPGKELSGTDEAAREEFEQLVVRLRGEEGAGMRERAQAVGRALEQSLSEGGEAWSAMARMLDDLAV